MVLFVKFIRRVWTQVKIYSWMSVVKTSVNASGSITSEFWQGPYIVMPRQHNKKMFEDPNCRQLFSNFVNIQKFDILMAF
jgi:hypothetical protein